MLASSEQQLKVDHVIAMAATAMYREMDMRFWLEKAGAEMNVLR